MGGYERGLGGGGWKFSRETVYIIEIIFDPRRLFVTREFKPSQFNKIHPATPKCLYFSQFLEISRN